MSTKRLFLFFISYLIIACKPPVKEIDPLPDLQQKGIYILNEGNFQSGQGSVSFYNFKTEELTEDIYFSKNNVYAGDVCQSLSFYNNKFYLVVNNSSKIDILNADFVKEATIAGLTSPRYLVCKNNTGYVSDLYANGVSVINLTTHQIEKKIQLKGWTEEMTLLNDTLYVTNQTSSYLYLINTGNNTMADSIDIGFGSTSLTVDSNGYLWVLTIGKSDLSVKPSLLCINTKDRRVIQKVEFQTYNNFLSRLNFNMATNELFWIDTDVKKMNIGTSALSAEIFVSAGTKNFYGLAIDSDGNCIVSNAGDFVQKSEIVIYDLKGVERKTFTAGIISGYMMIK